MNKKIQLSAAVLGVIITTAIVAGATSAAPNWNNNQKGNSENRGMMHEALEAGDYSLLGEDAKISEEQFTKLVERHNENDGKMFNRGQMKKGMRKHMDPEQREAVNEALDNEDYDAWVEAVGEDCPLFEKIDENNFSQLVEAHNLKKEGHEKMEEARAIMEELGIERPMPMRGLR